MFHVSARCQIGAVPPKSRTPRRAEFLAHPQHPRNFFSFICRQLNINFKSTRAAKADPFSFLGRKLHKIAQLGQRQRSCDLVMAEVGTTPAQFYTPNEEHLVTPVNTYERVRRLAGQQLEAVRLWFSTPPSSVMDRQCPDSGTAGSGSPDRILSSVPCARRSLQNVREESNSNRGSLHDVLVQPVLFSAANCGTFPSCPALGRSCGTTQQPTQAPGTPPPSCSLAFLLSLAN